MQSERLSPKQQIMVALGMLAIMRGGEYNQETLETFAAGLSTEPFEDVISVLRNIAERPRHQGETACPDFGTLLVSIRSIRHPLKRLREIVGALARIWHETADEQFLKLYEDAAGHRTDEDIERAYRALLEDDTLKRMPTPIQFRASCGIPKVYRDGTRPE